MKPILLRSPKAPFSVRSAEETVERDLIGTNSGNLVFLAAAHKLLSVPGREIDVDRFRYAARDAGRINERYDAYVIPLANAFRPQFEPALVRMTELIMRAGHARPVNRQPPLTADPGHPDRDPQPERSVRAFVAAVPDHGPSIGERGEMTADHLRWHAYREARLASIRILERLRRR